MFKLCPKCRKNNPEDVTFCEGCGEDLSRIRPSEGSSGITMFGGPPPQTSIKPLEKRSGDSLNGSSSAYVGKGSLAQREEEDEQLVTDHESPGDARCPKGRPKKPWE